MSLHVLSCAAHTAIASTRHVNQAFFMTGMFMRVRFPGRSRVLLRCSNLVGGRIITHGGDTPGATSNERPGSSSLRNMRTVDERDAQRPRIKVEQRGGPFADRQRC